jgi:hypothetical protein
LLVGHVHISTVIDAYWIKWWLMQRICVQFLVLVSWTYVHIIYFPLWKYHTRIAVAFLVEIHTHSRGRCIHGYHFCENFLPLAISACIRSNL